MIPLIFANVFTPSLLPVGVSPILRGLGGSWNEQPRWLGLAGIAGVVFWDPPLLPDPAATQLLGSPPNPLALGGLGKQHRASPAPGLGMQASVGGPPPGRPPWRPSPQPRCNSWVIPNPHAFGPGTWQVAAQSQPSTRARGAGHPRGNPRKRTPPHPDTSSALCSLHPGDQSA